MLRDMREQAGLTQRDLAKVVRHTQPWVHKTETGDRRADITEFLSWCLACKVDPEKAFRQLIDRTRGRL
jgi:predicted transcriptional regulator